ncbi:MAG: hypothetical protein QG602_142, partial [Verrucomicrobiota bacterium]|nr:hypothetical protein [Verrucomicrobiota bacterium]
RDAKQIRDVHLVLRPAPGFNGEGVALISPRFFAGAPLPR